jgi:hypothetical protein
MININPIWRGWINNWKKKRKLENFLFPKWLFLVFWFSRAVFTLWRFGRTQKAKHKWGSGGRRERTLSIDTQHAHKTHLWMLVITSLDWTGGPVHFAARTVKKRHTHTRKNNEGGATRFWERPRTTTTTSTLWPAAGAKLGAPKEPCLLTPPPLLPSLK